MIVPRSGARGDVANLQARFGHHSTFDSKTAAVHTNVCCKFDVVRLHQSEVCLNALLILNARQAGRVWGRV